MDSEHAGIDKTKSSCLLLTSKFKKRSEANISLNHSESYLETKRKPLIPKYSVSEENVLSSDQKGRPKFSGEPKVIELKMRLQSKDGRSR